MKKSLDFGSALKDLLAQALKGIRLKQLPIALRVIILILLLPTILIGAIMGFAYILFYGAYRFLSAPVDYLMNIVKSDGEEVKHATQAVIYWVGFPFCMMLQVFIAFNTLIMFTLFLGIHICVSVVTLGGVEWMPFLTEQRQRNEGRPYTRSPIASVVFDMLVMIIATVIFGLLFIVLSYGQINDLPSYLQAEVVTMCICFWTYISVICVTQVGKKLPSDKIPPVTKYEDLEKEEEINKEEMEESK